MEPLDPRIQAAIEACNRSHGVCLAMSMNHCLEAGGEHVAPPHFRLMADCAQLCATTADFMLRGSAHVATMTAACAEVCDACADSCDALDGMAECAAACRACAGLCRAFSQPH